MDHGMSVEELADRLDIPVDCMEDIEEGRRRLSKATIKEVASIFGESEEKLLEQDAPRSVAPVEVPPEVKPEAIGKKIRELREAKGLTLSEAGRKAGLSAAHLSEVERGLTAASLKTLEKIAEVLDISPAVLLGKDECDPLGERLRRLRERVGMTQKELAEAVQVSHTLVGQIENGRMQPAVSTLSALATALGVSPCYFLIEESDVFRSGQAVDDAVTRSLEYPEVRNFLAMVDELSAEERAQLLGVLSWLTDWRMPIRTGGSCATDPAAQELLQIVDGLNPDDKAFLLESARFVGRKHHSAED
jgi:transcriptional regulator with XRE-family HTH domain